MTDLARYGGDVIDAETGEIVPASAPADGLATLEQVQRMLEMANSPTDAKRVADAADTLRHLAKKAELGREAQNEASELKLRAQRMGGGMLSEMELDRGGRPPENRLSDSTGFNLGGNGISKYESMTWQKIASVPADAFEERIAEVRSHATWELTTADILKLLGQDNHRAMGTGENEWYTPPDVLEDVRALLGTIELDPASSDAAQKHVKAQRYFTINDDALGQDWEGKVFLNPPYAQPAIEHFATKLAAEYQAGRITEAVMLTHNYTDTRWFHVAESVSAAICFTRGRIRFLDPEGNLAAPTQGQAFFYLGNREQAFREIFASRGFIR